VVFAFKQHKENPIMGPLPLLIRWLKTKIQVLKARLAYPTDDVLLQIDEGVGSQPRLMSKARKRRSACTCGWLNRRAVVENASIYFIR
jgi:hypothetical protein